MALKIHIILIAFGDIRISHPTLYNTYEDALDQATLWYKTNNHILNNIKKVYINSNLIYSCYHTPEENRFLLGIK